MSSINFYYCLCPRGFSGAFCDGTVDYCDKFQCLNGGTCTLDAQKFPYCKCANGYAGIYCQFKVCQLDCMNQGVCNANGTCSCLSNWTGFDCSIPMNPCSSDPCVKGVCFSNLTSYSCKCDVAYTGRNCDSKIKVKYFFCLPISFDNGYS